MSQTNKQAASKDMPFDYIFNFHCQYLWIWNHLGDRYTSVYVLRSISKKESTEGKDSPRM